MGSWLGHTRGTGTEVGDGAPVKYPRYPSRGDIISVVVTAPGFSNRLVVRGAIVKKPGHEIRCVYTDNVFRRGSITMEFVTNVKHNFHVRLRDEGRTWARGVEGPAAEALQVYVALT